MLRLLAHKIKQIVPLKINRRTNRKNENEELINFEEKEDMSRLEQGILLVGESVKGGYYLTAVQSAYLNASNDSVVVNVSVKMYEVKRLDYQN